MTARILFCLCAIFAQSTFTLADSFELDTNFSLGLPGGMTLGPVSGLAIDTGGNLIIAHRGPRPILVVNPMGQIIQMFGDAELSMVHGARTDASDNIWVTDSKNHTVIQYSPAGKVLLTLGQRDRAGNDERTFDRPTDVAFAPDGSFFVTDGYGNSRVVKFNKQGEYIKAWGTKGRGAGQLNLPHAIQIDAAGRLHVGDRENNRVQIYDQEGELLGSRQGYAPFGLCLAADQTMFVADGRANQCLHISASGELLSKWGSQGPSAGQFKLPHCIAVDREGRVYVGEIDGRRLQRFKP